MKKQNEINKQQMSLNTAKNSSKNRKKLTLHKVAKGMQGITLIALVVTIIVLLILAGIALNLTIGENGIFSRAEKAANTWRNAESNEQLALGELANWIDDYTPKPAKSLVQAFKDGEIEIGDYINYKPNSGTYTSSGDKNGYGNQTFKTNTTIRWRVLGLSEDGNNLLITTEEPIGKTPSEEAEAGYWETDPYYYLRGAAGAFYSTDYEINGEEYNGELDNICAIYGNSYAEEARSMRTEDINNLLGLIAIEEGENKGLYKKSDIEAGNYNNSQDAMGAMGYETLGDTHEWQAGWNTPGSALGRETAPSEGENYPMTAYGYIYGSEESPNIDIGVTEEIYDLVFSGTEDYDDKPYWLASSGAYFYPDFSNVVFGPGAVGGGLVVRGGVRLFDSDGGEDLGSLLVRPVVSLRSGVTVDEITVEKSSAEN